MLSSRTTLFLANALTSESAAAEVQAAILAHSAVSADTLRRLQIMTTSDSVGSEIATCIVTPAVLSDDAQKRLMIGLADVEAASELILAISGSAATVKL